ncbi:hypothetical protein [Phytomonospora endophytica]|uniref:Uncharacterized protein n=1 Tax=Phytomonospora endophytica TaxID=714109 RepID=A0A841FGT1_9ACTN|nr:hypothetical protein [Phytomonospora endophytica]MBB6035436.1 hypothetical protein [Phytomonospora endophytica]GIG63812.1 hypothetical protein Pen01_01070 [Phytomonospora endophytica]
MPTYSTATARPALAVVRKAAGLAAAGAVGLYLAVKVVWVVAALVSGRGGGADWIALNVVTIGMAGIGVALGLALAMPWGARLSARLVVFVAWVGAGFLVPMIPFMAVRGFIDGGGETESVMPAWHEALLVLGFGGMALGLAVAVPLYLLERWPGSAARTAKRITPLWTVGGAIALAALWTYWAAGGEFGMTGNVALTAPDRLLLANSALWALIGAAATRLPALCFIASGSLFAWCSWKLLATVTAPGGFAPAELVPVAVVEYGLGAAVGAAMLAGLVRAYRLLL